jgi:diguanylate cyclase (GGDEF)-like protein
MHSFRFSANSLTRRFTLALAAIGAAALFLIATASWWLVGREHADAVHLLLQKELDYNAKIVSSNLQAISSHLADVADSSILAAGLVDTAGRQTYLTPYLDGIRQINGIPIHILFTDFTGQTIADNGIASFNEQELAWLKAQIGHGADGSAILAEPQGPVVVVAELLRYSRTQSAEGALLYKFALSDVDRNLTGRLLWGQQKPPDQAVAAPLAAPPNFSHLGLRIAVMPSDPAPLGLEPHYALIFGMVLALTIGLLVIGSRLSLALTLDLRKLEAFSRSVVQRGIGAQRADTSGSSEVSSLAHSVNHMLDRLHRQHMQLQEESAKLQRLAFYDSLTHLPNRRLLFDRLKHALAACARSHRLGALLFIDLDNFKGLNDTLGHDQGDLMLQQVAQRLTACVRESDLVARLGGDEFVVLLEGEDEPRTEFASHARLVGTKILAALGQPYQLGNYEYRCTPSIGINLFDGSGDSADDVLGGADFAMYQSKAAGRNTVRFFDPDMQAAVSARAALEEDLRRGMPQQEFVLHYQPQMDSQGRMVGAETLVRWRHPGRGVVPPSEFIPLAEETGLILQLGQWVMEAACEQLAAWTEHPRNTPLSLAINVSARQCRHPDFVEQVLGALDRSGADPQRIKLELTESLLVDDVEDTIAKMTALRARGVRFSLDDFGTGYSSLTYLKRLPLDQLKIDRSFVQDVLTDPNDASIVRTIVALGQSMGLEVMAEGVETEAQRDFLAVNGCNIYQGFLFSRPLPPEEFEALMQETAGAV